MSTWHRVLGAHGKSSFDSGDDDDLEQGRQPTTMPDDIPPRTSYSDSEFSEHECPVSPGCFEEALQAIEGGSPASPTETEDLLARVGNEVQNAGLVRCTGDECGCGSVAGPCERLMAQPDSPYE